MPIAIPPSIQPVLDHLLDQFQAILGEKLVGVYAYGSLTFGDFDATSDLDLLVATTSTIDDNDFSRLDQMHHEFIRDYPEWENRVEIAYVARYALQTFKTERSPIGVISPGEPFHMIEAGNDWLMNWYLVQRHGVTLWGESPATLIDHITPAEFLAAVHVSVQEWRERVAETSDLNWQAYAILTLCRAFYTHRHGEHVSKPVAARWTSQQFPQWASVIERALVWREETIHTHDMEAMMPTTREFVHFMIEQILGEA